jgi:hypothetical protein
MQERLLISYSSKIRGAAFCLPAIQFPADTHFPNPKTKLPHVKYPGSDSDYSACGSFVSYSDQPPGCLAGVQRAIPDVPRSPK